MKAPKPAPREIAPAGNHVARLYQIIHLGTTSFVYMGETKTSDKIRLTFELCNEKKEFKEGDGEKPIAISREFGFSMHKKSKLRPFIEGMLGKSFTDEEAYDLEVESLIGKACLLNVVHVEKKGNMYADIQNATPLPKGMEAPDMVNPPQFLDVSESTKEELDALPEFLREKVQASVEYGFRFLGKGSSEDQSLEEAFAEEAAEEEID